MCTLGAALRATVHLIPWAAVFTTQLITNALSGMYLWGWLIYWVILGGWLALNYYERFVTSELRRERLERRFSEARLDNLRLQLDPHFLFNTLNSISAYVESAPGQARLMLEQLGDLLRLSLEHADQQEITLERELTFVDRYIELQLVRFADRLQVKVDTDPDALTAAVPTFLLQPLLENAIRHGTSKLSAAGRIEVTAWRSGDRLHVRVRDNGPGLPRGWSLDRHIGIGLGNTRARLEQLYGKGQFSPGGDVRRRAVHVRRYHLSVSRRVSRQRGLYGDHQDRGRRRREAGARAPARAPAAPRRRRGRRDGVRRTRSARRVLRRVSPHLLFLDVQMPQLDGFGVLRQLTPEELPITIMVTAYDKYAVQAFDAHAIDYLLKPFSDERFEATMARVRARLGERDLRGFGQRLVDLAAATSPPARYWDRLVVKAGGTTRFVRAAEIDWVEGAGVYATLHVGRTSFLYRAALSELAERLDPRRFVRIHRSAIVESRKRRAA